MSVRKISETADAVMCMVRAYDHNPETVDADTGGQGVPESRDPEPLGLDRLEAEARAFDADRRRVPHGMAGVFGEMALGIALQGMAMGHVIASGRPPPKPVRKVACAVCDDTGRFRGRKCRQCLGLQRAKAQKAMHRKGKRRRRT